MPNLRIIMQIPLTGYNGIVMLQMFANLLSWVNYSNFIYVVDAKYAKKLSSELWQFLRYNVREGNINY